MEAEEKLAAAEQGKETVNETAELENESKLPIEEVLKKYYPDAPSLEVREFFYFILETISHFASRRKMKKRKRKTTTKMAQLLTMTLDRRNKSSTMQQRRRQRLSLLETLWTQPE